MSAVNLGTKESYKHILEDIVLFGRKMFMTTEFDKETGDMIPCTILEIEPNVVTGISKQEEESIVKISAIKDKGGSEKSVINRLSKPAFGFFKKLNLSPMKESSEFRTSSIHEECAVGDAIHADIFADCAYLDISGTSKGKGYQGVMKKHGFSGGPSSHGSTRFHRGRGSIGTGRSTPGRVFKNTKMASRMGGEKVLVENVRLIKVLKNEDLNIEPKVPGTMWVAVRGSVPGANSSLLKLRVAKKKNNKK